MTDCKKSVENPPNLLLKKKAPGAERAKTRLIFLGYGVRGFKSKVKRNLIQYFECLFHCLIMKYFCLHKVYIEIILLNLCLKCSVRLRNGFLHLLHLPTLL